MAGLLLPRLSGFRNVATANLPNLSFPFLPFFITETECPLADA